jgi:dTDP-4-dehydrorhamnose 3,5-epimerase
VSEGFAHGFLVLSDTVDFFYKCSDFYAPGDEYGIIWNDTALGINWPADCEPLVSEKDALLPRFAEAEFFD